MLLTTEIAVILGALIGGGISILTNRIQQKNQLKREFTKIAYEMAVKEYETQIKHGTLGEKVAPLEAFVTYYIKYLEIVKSEKFKLEDLNKIRDFRKNLNSFYEKELKN